MASYAQIKGRASKNQNELKKSLNGNTFTPLRHDVINSAEFMALSTSAKWVFIKLCSMYNRFNNGDLSAPQDKAQEIFALSSKTLKKALDELIKTDFLQVTRVGGKNQCSLYALTCYKLNDIQKGNILLVKETQRPSDDWRKS